MDEKWKEMRRLISSERLQEVAIAGFNGERIRNMTEAEKYFYDRAVKEREELGDVTVGPVDYS